MGAWSESINGNDTAQDLKSEYQAAFLYNDVETALQKLDALVRENFCESDEEDWCDYYYSLADFMWKHGILTPEVRDRAISMIDSGFGLDLWAEAGEAVLKKRKKALERFRQKLSSPQPPVKKIKLDLHPNSIFETGDLVAIQLQTADKHYLEKSNFGEDYFRECDGKYVVLRKVADKVSFFSSVEPRAKDVWAIFQLYGRVFDGCPTPEQLRQVPFANTVWNQRYNDPSVCNDAIGTFVCESSMFYFKKRKFQLIGNDRQQLPPMFYNDVLVFFSINRPWCNADTDLLNAIHAKT